MHDVQAFVQLYLVILVTRGHVPERKESEFFEDAVELVQQVALLSEHPIPGHRRQFPAQ